MEARKEVFISYSRKDAAVVELAERLMRAGGADVFRDLHGIPFGADWRQTIEESITRSDRVLLFWSAAASMSPWVRREIKLALRLQKTIVPILLDASALPSRLSRLNALPDFRHIQFAAEASETRMHSVLAHDSQHPDHSFARRLRSVRALLGYIHHRYARHKYVIFGILPIVTLLIIYLTEQITHLSVWPLIPLVTVFAILVVVAIIAPVIIETLRDTKRSEHHPNSVVARNIDIRFAHTGFVNTRFAGSDAEDAEKDYKLLGSEFVSTVFAYSNLNPRRR